MEILETKGRKMNKIKREERENLHTFSDTTDDYRNQVEKRTEIMLKSVVICIRLQRVLT